MKDAFAKGEVFLGNKDHGYSVSAGLPAGTNCNGTWQLGITIQTPDRCFLFTCETENDQQDWLKHFNDVMSAQMSPQEYTSKKTKGLNNHSASRSISCFNWQSCYNWVKKGFSYVFIYLFICKNAAVSSFVKRPCCDSINLLYHVFSCLLILKPWINKLTFE